MNTWIVAYIVIALIVTACLMASDQLDHEDIPIFWSGFIGVLWGGVVLVAVVITPFWLAGKAGEAWRQRSERGHAALTKGDQ